MTKIIEVIVSAQGEIRLQTRGFSGATCQLASQFLEEALGAKTGQHLTAEYYSPAVELDQYLNREGGHS